jgi:hypothetical protein
MVVAGRATTGIRNTLPSTWRRLVHQVCFLRWDRCGIALLTVAAGILYSDLFANSVKVQCGWLRRGWQIGWGWGLEDFYTRDLVGGRFLIVCPNFGRPKLSLISKTEPIDHRLRIFSCPPKSFPHADCTYADTCWTYHSGKLNECTASLTVLVSRPKKTHKMVRLQLLMRWSTTYYSIINIV